MTIPAERLYTHLCWHGTAAGTDLFDLHVAASILAMAAQDAEASGRTLSEACGLGSAELRDLFLLMFPGAAGMLGGLAAAAVVPAADERQLREILFVNSAHASPFERLLAHMIARRSLSPDHLWQDLGFGSRRVLSKLMRRHYPRLAERNAQEMKWKKFFYRMMCAATDYALCVAPVCSECDEFDACFGAEDGPSRLARIGAGPLPLPGEIRA
ncbi:nitrogen fixation protein NifQ [Sphingomonas hengshuiensis]|uniref:nitrogen fixation protein NifQ n=1 Tax=Sphingomonas hengshuiensis TaxID=1609977 RepID=UPI000696EA5B|nr:nitrogen fixation protein NifQ [Sphingomonas hengshuiensis]